MSELLALRIRPSAILRVDPATGEHAVLVEDAGPTPDGITVVDGTVYWTTMGESRSIPGVDGEAGRDFSARNGGIQAVRLDGSGRREVLPAGALTTGKQLTSDGARLYWGDREGCRISACGLDGSDPTDLVAAHRDGAWSEECVGVAVDPERGWVYWTRKGPAKGGAGRILRAPLTGPGDPWSRTDVETLWEGLPEPIDLELDGEHLYWTDRGAEPEGNTLNRAPVPAPGERGAEPEILARGFDEAIGLAVDAERGWSTSRTSPGRSGPSRCPARGGRKRSSRGSAGR